MLLPVGLICFSKLPENSDYSVLFVMIRRPILNKERSSVLSTVANPAFLILNRYSKHLYYGFLLESIVYSSNACRGSVSGSVKQIPEKQKLYRINL